MDLAEAYSGRIWAAYGDESRVKLDFDGAGRAFPLEEFLPDATYPPLGYQPGYCQGAPVLDAPGFHFGTSIKGAAPVVRADGQTIKLPDKPATALYLVGACTKDPHPADFVIHYKDGTEQHLSLTFANWLGGPQHGEPLMLRSTHVHTATGDDWTQHGALYVYKLTLDPTRMSATLLLPDSPDLAIFSATLELPAK